MRFEMTSTACVTAFLGGKTAFSLCCREAFRNSFQALPIVFHFTHFCILLTCSLYIQSGFGKLCRILSKICMPFLKESSDFHNAQHSAFHFS